MAQCNDDPFSFDAIQLQTQPERRGMHRLDDGEQIQRPDAFDDLCQGLLLQARIDRIVHGFEGEGQGPATLVIFGFRFHGLNEKRRFKEAVINITFQDEQKRRHHRYDPEVISLWPNGMFTLGEPTVVELESRREGKVRAEVTAGGAGVVQGGARAAYKWETTKSFKRLDRAILVGSMTLDTTVRHEGGNNLVRLTISENHAAASGIVTDLRAAVLLRRKNDDDTFTASVRFKAKADFRYDCVRGVRDILGFSPPNGPVRFKPGVQYLRPPTLGDEMESRLAASIDANKLNAARLNELAGILSATVLAI
ncbi:hypothetical protein ASPZODRAFT_20792 [Penicilliopsis zonata CBS 506.65]|uniref:Uncharacterized protein n=1 Tax=Penicilliopsis zonata CBS 506.65 TaxID=1073090 RepID=A0A1L9S4L0_9EURO|nr:hypothetical protein ASPZODRAFT_20792 [Penicilliopsis zonata CBS 506.65]OJJ42105.1 hypothetical protein ASPZODRAFT_20792 [Penicilliopsis zonata CBS 506.65]